MNDLITWLRGVLDDDEQAAQSATPGHWGAQPGPTQSVFSDEWEVVTDAHEPSHSDHYVVFTGYEGGGATSEQNAVHIARHDPAAVLSDIAAKRTILDAYTTRANIAARSGAKHRDPLGFVVRTLASAYRHRPGWQDAWE